MWAKSVGRDSPIVDTMRAEQLAEEIGLYRDMPLGPVGRIQSFLYRAARVVIDTGLHAQGWGRDRAIRYMVDTVGLAPLAAQSEIDRYIVWPGQALAYKIGELKIKELRALAEKELGPQFDIRAFHDEVLGRGSLPLDVLDAKIREWIAERKGR